MSQVVSDETDLFEGSDVWDNQLGVRLDLYVTALNSTSGLVIPGMRFDFWAANATGVYSDIAAQNTFGVEYMRGFVFTNASGIAKFKTIIPGRYVGRTNHIHLRVRIGAGTLRL